MHVVVQFAVECEVIGMNVSISKSEAMLDGSLWIGRELLPLVKEFKYLRVLFTSEGQIDGQADWCSKISNVDIVPDCSGEGGAELEGKAFDLLVHLLSNSHLWS